MRGVAVRAQIKSILPALRPRSRVVLVVRRRRGRPTMPAANLKQRYIRPQGLFVHVVRCDRDRPGSIRHYFAADDTLFFQAHFGGNRGRAPDRQPPAYLSDRERNPMVGTEGLTQGVRPPQANLLYQTRPAGQATAPAFVLPRGLDQLI